MAAIINLSSETLGDFLSVYLSIEVDNLGSDRMFL